MNPKIDELLPTQYHAVVFEFVLAFSRFEYALKRANFIIGPPQRPEPDWEGFAAKYKDQFSPSASEDLRAACDYYKNHPPRKQIRNTSGLDWSPPHQYGSEPFLTWLLVVVRRVRNNLFHGGKFTMPVADPARDSKLLGHGLTILYSCLPLDGNVNAYFISN